MESLLSLSFDNLSSREHGRIRKGIRQIDGLLAQICLPSTLLSPDDSGGAGDEAREKTKPLASLKKDAAFRDFFRIQEGFRWNVATRLIWTLERLLGVQASPSSDALLLTLLSTLQGLLLLHPPSRILFATEDTMNLLLDLLDPKANPPTVLSQALLVLVTALLDNPANTRVFEAVDGLLTVTSLLKSKSTTQEVKMRALEVMYFYLMPEKPPARPKQDETDEGDSGARQNTKSTAQKQRLLGRHLNNVAELVRDLQENAVFGTAMPAGS